MQGNPSEVGAPLRYSAKDDVLLTIHRTYVSARIGRRPAGRAVGCAQAPQAGLAPRGLPSLTQSGESPERVQLLIRSEAASHVLGSGRPPGCMQRFRPRMRRMETTVSRSSLAVYDKQLSLTPHIRMTVVLAVNQNSNDAARTKDVHFGNHASGEEPAPLSNGLSLVPVRPSTINPQGVRYASVRPLRLRLRGDRSRPRTRRRLSSGDGPRRKTGAFQCRTISRSLRAMPSIWPAR